VAGVEPDAAYVARARQRYPWLPLVQGEAARLPVRAGAVQAVVLLDVLEHVAGRRQVLSETRRVLATGGTLILSVPHAGWLAALDSLNLYDALRRRWPWLPALDPGERSTGGSHTHFSVAQLARLLGDGWRIERVARTGLGLAEVIHLAVLLLFRVALRWEQGYRGARFLYYTAYLLDDLLPAGRWGYHVALLARARERSPG
jgi:SAM-dependent methyltransferase